MFTKLAVIGSLMLGFGAAPWDGQGGGVDCGKAMVCGGNIKGDGISTIGQVSVTRPGSNLTNHNRNDATPGPRFDYAYTSPCGGTPGSAIADVMCQAAFAACRGITPPTSMTVVWRRQVDANGSPIAGNGWSRVGEYCVLPNIPGAPPAPPRPTITDIQRVFHLTPWATAGITIQPPNGVTLVNLDTFYRLTWTAAGFEPGEIDTIDPARMLGHTVKIKPRIVAITYNFGDGTSSPPTTDVGAPWPKGKIKHTYLDKGTYQVSADIEMTADFTIDGSGWIPLDNTVTLHSTPTTLVAKEAHPVTKN